MSEKRGIGICEKRVGFDDCYVALRALPRSVHFVFTLLIVQVAGNRSTLEIQPWQQLSQNSTLTLVLVFLSDTGSRVVSASRNRTDISIACSHAFPDYDSFLVDHFDPNTHANSIIHQSARGELDIATSLSSLSFSIDSLNKQLHEQVWLRRRDNQTPLPIGREPQDCSD